MPATGCLSTSLCNHYELLFAIFEGMMDVNMSKIWRWIFGIVIALALLGLIIFGSPNRQAYHKGKRDG